MESGENSNTSKDYHLAVTYDYGDQDNSSIQEQAQLNHEFLNQDLLSILKKIDDRCLKTEQLVLDKVKKLEQKIDKFKIYVYENTDNYKSKLKNIKVKYNSLIDIVNKINEETNKISYIQEESLKACASLEELSSKVESQKSFTEEDRQSQISESQFIPMEMQEININIGQLEKHIQEIDNKYQQEISQIKQFHNDMALEQKGIKEQTQEINKKYDSSLNKLQEIEKIVTEDYQKDYKENKIEMDKTLKSIQNLNSQQESLINNGEISKENNDKNSKKIQELEENFNRFQQQIQKINEKILQIKEEEQRNMKDSKSNIHQKEMDTMKIILQDLLRSNREVNLKLTYYIKFLKPIINKVDEKWIDSLDTQLIAASKNGNTYMVSLMVDLGTNVNARDLDKSPLHYAADNGFEPIVKLLIKHQASIDGKDNYCNTPLHFAAGKGHLSVVTELLKNNANKNCKNMINETPFHKAAEKGHVSIIAELIKYGANINCRNSGDRTPLHYAADNGHLAVTNFLIKNGVDITAKTKDGKTALDLATIKEYLEIIKVLQECRV